jgi:single-stranded DNA-binding protein
MMDAIIGGRLYGKPERRTGKNGDSFVTAKVRAVPVNGETLFVNVIGFSEQVCAALLALDDGDGVSLAGAITPKAWIDRNGEARPALDMRVHGVLTAYHVKHKRRAMSSDADE